MNDNTCGHECCSPDLEDGCTVDKCVDHPHGAPPIIDPSKPVPIDVAMNLARREYAAGMRVGDQRLEDALTRLVAVSPTAILSGDCDQCYNGTVNVGSSIDPEPGSCPRCRCEFHREPHPDCFEHARAVLAARRREADAKR